MHRSATIFSPCASCTAVGRRPRGSPGSSPCDARNARDGCLLGVALDHRRPRLVGRLVLRTRVDARHLALVGPPPEELRRVGVVDHRRDPRRACPTRRASSPVAFFGIAEVAEHVAARAVLRRRGSRPRSSGSSRTIARAPAGGRRCSRAATAAHATRSAFGALPWRTACRAHPCAIASPASATAPPKMASERQADRTTARGRARPVESRAEARGRRRGSRGHERRPQELRGRAVEELPQLVERHQVPLRPRRVVAERVRRPLERGAVRRPGQRRRARRPRPPPQMVRKSELLAVGDRRAPFAHPWRCDEATPRAEHQRRSSTGNTTTCTAYTRVSPSAPSSGPPASIACSQPPTTGASPDDVALDDARPPAALIPRQKAPRDPLGQGEPEHREREPPGDLARLAVARRERAVRDVQRREHEAAPAPPRSAARGRSTRAAARTARRRRSPTPSAATARTPSSRCTPGHDEHPEARRRRTRRCADAHGAPPTTG